MSGRFSMSKVGLDVGQLLTTDDNYIQTQVIEAVRAKLVARNIFPVQPLDSIGIKTWKAYNLTDMSAARIDLDGLNVSYDRTKKTERSVVVPMIHKEFMLLFRDVAASRASGMPIDVSEPQNAGIQVAEEEDKLCLSGEYTGWRALGIEGLATATGRNTEASAGAWTTATNVILDVSDAIAELETDGHQGPYDLVCRSAHAANLRLLIANTGILAKEKILQMVRNIYVSDNLYTAAGGTDSALVVEADPMNFVLGVAAGIQVYTTQDENMNIKGKVWEICTPFIKRPTSICEITGIT